MPCCGRSIQGMQKAAEKQHAVNNNLVTQSTSIGLQKNCGVCGRRLISFGTDSLRCTKCNRFIKLPTTGK